MKPLVSSPQESIVNADWQQQQAAYVKLSYDEFRLEFGIDIVITSKKNLDNLKTSLGELSEEEAQLKMVLMANLTARHKTDFLANIQETGSLLSVRERENRTEKKVENSHTARIGGNTNVFFTIGLGNHRTPAFLDSKDGEIIELRLQPLFAQGNIVDGLFISGHLSDYRHEITSRPIWMGDTFFQFTHDDVKKQKIYTYKSADGRMEAYTVAMADEVFCGHAVLEGLTLLFIQHLRRIGGRYQKHIYDTMANESSAERKVEILSVAMHYIMPGWIYPEGKLPGELPAVFNNPHITVISDPKKSFEYCFNVLAEFADPSHYYHSTFNKEQKKELLQIHSHYLTDLYKPWGKELLAEPLALAAAENNLEMVEIFLGMKTPDRKDPTIMRMADPNGGFSRDARRGSLMEQVCYEGHYEVLQALITAGAKITGYSGYYYLCLTAKNADKQDPKKTVNRRKCFEILLQNGANFERENSTVLKVRYKTPLVNFAIRGDVEGVRLCMAHNADINKRFHKTNIMGFIGSYGPVASVQNGYTALHFLMVSKHKVYAGEEGAKLRLEIAQALIQGGADPSIAADNGDTIYSLAKKNGHNNIVNMLEKEHNNIVAVESKRPICNDYKKVVAIIVIGKNKEGQDVVLVGKKKNSDGSIQQKYLAPGGFVDKTDRTPIDAALRELKEETFIDLQTEVTNKQVEASILYQYEGIETQFSGYTTHYTVSYVLLNVGSLLATKEFGSRDDLHEVTTIPLTHIRMNTSAPVTKKYYVVNSLGLQIPIMPSNARIFTHLRETAPYMPLPLQVEEELKEFSAVETLGKYRLVAAAAAGNLAEVIYLVQTFGFSLEYAKSSYPQALCEAACLGNLEIVKVLVEHGALINARSKMVHTFSKNTIFQHAGALSAAALGGNIEVFTYLFKLTLEQKDESTNNEKQFSAEVILKNALSTAAVAGHVCIAQYILEHSAVCVDDTDEFGWGWGLYPLTLAVEAGKIDMVRFLIGKGSNVNAACSYNPYDAPYRATYQSSPILVAIERGYDDIAKILMGLPQTNIDAHWVSPSRSLETVRNPLFAAIQRDNEPLVAWILNNTDIDLYATNHKHEETGLEFSIRTEKYKSALSIILHKIAAKLCRRFNIEATELALEVGLDEKNKPTVHIIIKDIEIAREIEKRFKATLWECTDSQGYILRFGAKRLKDLMLFEAKRLKDLTLSSKLYQYICDIYKNDPTIVAPARDLKPMDNKKVKNEPITDTLTSPTVIETAMETPSVSPTMNQIEAIPMVLGASGLPSTNRHSLFNAHSLEGRAESIDPSVASAIMTRFFLRRPVLLAEEAKKESTIYSMFCVLL